MGEVTGWTPNFIPKVTEASRGRYGQVKVTLDVEKGFSMFLLFFGSLLVFGGCVLASCVVGGLAFWLPSFGLLGFLAFWVPFLSSLLL